MKINIESTITVNHRVLDNYCLFVGGFYQPASWKLHWMRLGEFWAPSKNGRFEFFAGQSFLLLLYIKMKMSTQIQFKNCRDETIYDDKSGDRFFKPVTGFLKTLRVWFLSNILKSDKSDDWGENNRFLLNQVELPILIQLRILCFSGHYQYEEESESVPTN